MKLAKLVGERFKERPSDCVIDSHALMVRGGYIKYVTNGIYSSYMPLRRITRKIEQIIREEMDGIDGQEVQFPVVMPAALWQESGRYDSISSELVRLQDRNKTPLVLGMTHEEAAVQLVREYAGSYSRYPFMIYQIQTKFRDEARPRGGLIRVREFTMKDGYSFHTSQQDLEDYYARCHKAYERIFARAGVPEVIAVASDSGMMGGNVSHEFMLLTPVGEDSIAVCGQCGYSANMEAAPCIVKGVDSTPAQELVQVHTPNVHSIEELTSFFATEAAHTCKAVVYQRNHDDSLVVVFLRGDLDANETKLRNLLGCEIHPALLGDDSVLQAGFIGPVGLPEGITVLYDRSLTDTNNLICGANRADNHCTGLYLARDVGAVEYHDLAKAVDGGICPQCGGHTLGIHRGIEVGNIFQLGTKYSKAMGMTYLASDGSTSHPVMGCYGIGVGRLAASICEARHDDYGPIWPMAIAPWQVQLCAVRVDAPEVRACADKLYSDLQAAGVEVIYDDREVSAGVMFSDADLLGVPLRVIVSPRNLGEGCCEIVSRDKSLTCKEKTEDTVGKVCALIAERLAK